MNMKIYGFFWFALLCVCIRSSGAVNGNTALSYYCLPNDTIVIDNSDAYSWYRADAADDTVCNMAPLSDELRITGCPKDTRITVMLSNRTDTSTHIIYGSRASGESDLLVYIIMCSEISSDGITRMVDDAVTPSIPATFQPTVSPSFTLTSFIYTDSTKDTRATVANSGDELYWNIVGPVEYDHKPEECIAFAGLVVTPTVSNKTIINSGCTLDSSLVSDFAFVNGSGDEVSSTIYAFRFFSSEFVTFECKVRVCPSGESDCAIDCSGRRRRSMADDLTNTQQFSVVSHIRVDTPRIIDLRRKALRSESASIGGRYSSVQSVRVLPVPTGGNVSSLAIVNISDGSPTEKCYNFAEGSSVVPVILHCLGPLLLRP